MEQIQNKLQTIDDKAEIDHRPVVLITGFGPFGCHLVNSSWVSVQEISKEYLENKYNVQILSKEIPVIYNVVDSLISELWKKYQPKLVIHVGVSSLAQELTLETLAHGSGYKRPDCDGKCPAKNNSVFYCQNQKDVITCGFNVKNIVDDYNKLGNVLVAKASTDAGRFLCEYTYFSSLTFDSSRTLFVHVPDVINGQFSAKNVAKGLENVIDLCLESLSS